MVVCVFVFLCLGQFLKKRDQDRSSGDWVQILLGLRLQGKYLQSVCGWFMFMCILKMWTACDTDILEKCHGYNYLVGSCPFVLCGLLKWNTRADCSGKKKKKKRTGPMKYYEHTMVWLSALVCQTCHVSWGCVGKATDKKNHNDIRWVTSQAKNKELQVLPANHFNTVKEQSH